jgi:hypothetical protein
MLSEFLSRYPYETLPDFAEAKRMNENAFSAYMNCNFMGDVNIDIFRKAAGRFLESNVPTLCHLLACQRFKTFPSMVVTGSAAYKTIALQTGLYGDWYSEMTGLNRMGPEENEVRDFDIWVPFIVRDYLITKGYDFKQTGSNRNIEIAEVVDGEAKFQIHSTTDPEVNPLVASAFTTTDLLATCLVFNGPDVYIMDPFAAIKKGLNQDFPYRIFDQDNTILNNQARRALITLVWAMSTPVFPEKIEGLDKIKLTVSGIINEMTQTELLSLAKKFIQFSIKEPFSDKFYEESVMVTPVKLVKVGILPALLNRLDQDESQPEFITAKHLLLQYIGDYLEEYDAVDEATYYKRGNYSKLEAIAKKIDWEKIWKK